MKTTKRWAAVATVIMLMGGSPAQAAQTPDTKRVFNIQPQPTEQALTEFGLATGLQVLFSTKVTAERRSPAVSGELSVREALEKLLAHSGLKYEFVNERTVRITSAAQGRASQDGEAGELKLARAGRNAMQKVEAAPGDEQSVDESSAGGDASGAAKDVSELVVSGTRLRHVETYAPVEVITREDIKRRGFNSMEDVIRSLSANASSLNSATGTNSQITGAGFQGSANFNLRGLGSENTLVLLNGRRLSKAPLIEKSGPDVAGIPINAVERIEIVTDGGSAVYGSDAVAGTVNIVLRKDFVGSETVARYEDSSNAANAANLSQMFGWGWGGGNLTANISYHRLQPVSAARAGFTTTDLSNLPGGYDQRTPDFSIQLNTPPYTAGALGPGTDPHDFTADDIDPDALIYNDNVGRNLSPDTRDMGLWTTLRQQFTPRVTGSLDLSFNRTRTRFNQAGAPQIFGTVPADSPINPTGEDLYISGELTAALAAGLVGRPYAIANDEEMSIGAGLGWDLPFRDWHWQTEGSYSRSKGRFAYNNQLIVNRDYVSEPMEAAFADGSFNPFDMASNGAAVYRTFIGPFSAESPDTEVQGITSYVEGRLAQFSAGQMRGVMGGELRNESSSGFSGSFAVRPSRDVAAAFGELSLPLVDAQRHVPWIAALDLKVAARWENYRVKGASFDGVEAVRVTENFTHTSPNAQMSWRPVRDLKLNLSWGQSFRAPSSSDLFSSAALSSIFGPEAVFDPFKPGTGGAGGIVEVNQYLAGNPVLKPEISSTTTLSLTWAPQLVPGLSLSAAYSRIDFSERISFPDIYSPAALARIFADPAGYPDFTPRDAQGNLLAIVGRPLNLAFSLSDSLDLNGEYSFATAHGTVTTGFSVTHMIARKEQLSAASKPLDLLGNSLDVVDRYKGSVHVDWERALYGASVVYNFASNYDNIGYDYDQGAFGNLGSIKGLSVWDLTGFCHFGARASWRVAGGARNLFNAKPPAVYLGGWPFDARRVDLRGRIAFLELARSF